VPKKVFTVNDFSGGLNTEKSAIVLEDNELAECTNFNVSSKGKIVASRIFKNSHLYGEGDSTGAETDPGYGLFTFSNDYLINMSEPRIANHRASSNATDNDGEFIVFTGDDNELDALEVSATGADSDAWQQDILIGATNPVGERQAFYAAEGDLFVGGTTDGGVLSTPASLVYHKQTQVPSASSGIAVAAWIAGTQSKPAPVAAVGAVDDSDMLIYETDGSGVDYNGATALEQDDLHWILRPSKNDDGAVTGGSGSSGLWSTAIASQAHHEFAVTWLYKNDAESDMTIIQSSSNNATEGQPNGAGMFGSTNWTDVTMTVRCYMSDNTPVTAASTTRYGARLYTRIKEEAGDWYLLAEMNFEKGIIGDGETEWNQWYNAENGNGEDHTLWSHPDTGDACTTGEIAAPPALVTYKIKNGHSPGDIPTSGLVKFKTGLVANSRAYIGNVEINGRRYGDRILKSPIYQYDVFTEDNYLDVAINDGDQITALAAHGDRILQFKNSALYIINVSKELEFLEDEQQGAGVEFQGAVTTTPFGVVWVNTNGCYLYDGDKVTQLQLGKISPDDWGDNITIRATIGYDTEVQQVIVLWDSNATANAFVFDAETGGWHKVTDIITATKHTTNMVQARGNKLLVGGGADINYVNFMAARPSMVSTDVEFLDNGGSADTITDGDSGFEAAGFKAGDIINISGSSNNNGLETIVTLYAGTIVLASGRNTAEDTGSDPITFSLVSTGYSLKTKVFDFGNSESKKNLLEVAVVYNGRGHTSLDFDIITGDGTSTKVDALDNTSGSTVTEEFDESGVAALQGQKTFQIHINGTCDALFELYSITLTYRDLGVH